MTRSCSLWLCQANCIRFGNIITRDSVVILKRVFLFQLLLLTRLETIFWFIFSVANNIHSWLWLIFELLIFLVLCSHSCTVKWRGFEHVVGWADVRSRLLGTLDSAAKSVPNHHGVSSRLIVTRCFCPQINNVPTSFLFKWGFLNWSSNKQFVLSFFHVSGKNFSFEFTLACRNHVSKARMQVKWHSRWIDTRQPCCAGPSPLILAKVCGYTSTCCRAPCPTKLRPRLLMPLNRIEWDLLRWSSKCTSICDSISSVFLVQSVASAWNCIDLWNHLLQAIPIQTITSQN